MVRTTVQLSCPRASPCTNRNTMLPICSHIVMLHILIFTQDRINQIHTSLFYLKARSDNPRLDRLTSKAHLQVYPLSTLSKSFLAVILIVNRLCSRSVHVRTHFEGHTHLQSRRDMDVLPNSNVTSEMSPSKLVHLPGKPGRYVCKLTGRQRHMHTHVVICSFTKSQPLQPPHVYHTQESTAVFSCQA